jgi:hypothetical protein
VKLALLAAAGVVAMHAIHLAIGNRLARRALAAEQAVLGRTIARLVARQAADPLLVNDPVTLHELVSSATEDDDVAYCFIVRDGRVVASSFEAATPTGLVALRARGDRAPIIVRSGDTRILDVLEPILDGDVGDVRLGLDMRSTASMSRELAIELGLLAVAVIIAGVVAAFLTGRSIARPIDGILAAADRFDPSADAPVPEVSPRGSREIAVLGERFNKMMHRLRTAHAEQARAPEERGDRSARRTGLARRRRCTRGQQPLAGLKNCVRRLEREDLRTGSGASTRPHGGGARPDRGGRAAALDFGRPHLRGSSRSRSPGSRARQRRLRRARRPPHRHPTARRGSGRDRARGPAPRRQAIVNLVLNAAYVTEDGARSGSACAIVVRSSASRSRTTGRAFLQTCGTASSIRSSRRSRWARGRGSGSP